MDVWSAADAFAAQASRDLNESRMCWFLVRTHPHRERTAAGVLERCAGLIVYLPLIRVERVVCRKMRWVKRPYFPSYAFVRDDGDPWTIRKIRTAPGVVQLLSTGGAPARLNEAVIDGIRERERDDGTVRAWRPGQPVKVKGLDAVFKEETGEGRAAVFIKLFASEYEVEMPATEIVRA